MSESSPGTKLKAAIIGTGAIFRNHLEAYHALDDVEIVAVCDVNEELAVRTAQEHDIPRAFGSVTELLSAVNDEKDLGRPIRPTRPS